MAKQLRLQSVYGRSNDKAPMQTSHPIIKPLRSLPCVKRSTPLSLTSNNSTLESFLDHTKLELSKKLPQITCSKPSNLSKKEKFDIRKLKRSNFVIKPADKNLGIVILSRHQYISACTDHLRDPKT